MVLQKKTRLSGKKRQFLDLFVADEVGGREDFLRGTPSKAPKLGKAWFSAKGGDRKLRRCSSSGPNPILGE